MKKLFISAALLVGIISSSFAQTEKGDWLVGGTAGFKTTKGNSQFNLSPSAGYFFFDNFAAGAMVDLRYNKIDSFKTTSFGIGPFARYYFGKNIIRPFVFADWLFQSYKSPGVDAVNGSTIDAGVGLAAFLSNTVALEGKAGYNYSKVEHVDGNSGFVLNFGFQVYINGKKMSKVTKGNLK